jgi:hypothetical protein
MTHFRAEFIFPTFNENIHQTIHINTIYKPPILSIHHFINYLQTNFVKNSKKLSNNSNWRF